MAARARDTLIDCTGLDAKSALDDLRGVRGEMALVRSRDLSLSRPVRVLHPRIPLYVVPRENGLYMIGATMIESDDASAMTVRSALELLNAAYALHPAFGEAELVETGAGVRPAFADNLPRIRRHGETYFVNGLYRHGFLLAPALAEMTVEAVLHDRKFPEVMDEDHRQRRRA
jgi:glycine oxidase